MPSAGRWNLSGPLSTQRPESPLPHLLPTSGQMKVNRLTQLGPEGAAALPAVPEKPPQAEESTVSISSFYPSRNCLISVETIKNIVTERRGDARWLTVGWLLSPRRPECPFIVRVQQVWLLSDRRTDGRRAIWQIGGELHGAAPVRPLGGEWRSAATPP